MIIDSSLWQGLKRLFLFYVVQSRLSQFDFFKCSIFFFDDLKTAIDSFVKGEEVATTEGNLTLKDGIQLLEKNFG